MRPRVNVQWGKHGSMPHGWEALPIVADNGDIERNYLSLGTPISLLDYNRATWQKLRTEGRRLIDHPLSRRLHWPDKFDGEWDQFVAFTRLVDPLALIERHRMVSVSRWNSAVINQQFLAYNFRPKTEWPTESGSGPLRANASPPPLVEAASLDDIIDSQYAPNSVRKNAAMSPTDVLIDPRSNLVVSKSLARAMAGSKRPR